MSNSRFVALGGAIVLALGVAGCGSDSDSVPLSGSIRIDGSSSVAPLTRAMATRFAAEHPNVRIAVGASGTDRGVAKLCRGETDASDAVEPVDGRAVSACARAGVETAGIPVANDAIVLIVAPEVPVRCLTTRQLAQIWHGNSEVTEHWSQIDDLDPPYRGTLNAWGPGTDTESFAFFTKAINHSEGETRDYNNVLHRYRYMIDGVLGTTGNLGYVEYGLYERNVRSVRALAVDSGDGCVAPTPATIADGSYRPLSRRLYVYPSARALARPTMRAFMRFYLDDAAAAARETGFVPLTGEQLADSRARLGELTAGDGDGS